MAMTASMSVQLVPSFVPVTVMHLCPEGHAGVEAAAKRRMGDDARGYRKR